MPSQWPNPSLSGICPLVCPLKSLTLVSPVSALSSALSRSASHCWSLLATSSYFLSASSAWFLNNNVEIFHKLFANKGVICYTNTITMYLTPTTRDLCLPIKIGGFSKIYYFLKPNNLIKPTTQLPILSNYVLDKCNLVSFNSTNKCSKRSKFYEIITDPPTN